MEHSTPALSLCLGGSKAHGQSTAPSFLPAPFGTSFTPRGLLPLLRRYDKASGAQDGTFRDEVAVEEIREHNDEARRLNAEEAPRGWKVAADGRSLPAGLNATAGGTQAGR